MHDKYFLAIDMGTSSLKTCLFDTDFRIISRDTAEIETVFPKPTWAQQDQNQWWGLMAVAIKRVISKAEISPETVKAIGICGQMHGLNLVDDECNPLMPCLIWPDLRAITQAEAIRNSGLFPERRFYYTITAHFTAAKLLWVKENYPNILDKAYKFLLPKDFLRTRLTGKGFYTDPSDAAGTQMFDLEKQVWDWKSVDYIGVSHDLFPEIRPADEIVGGVSKEAAVETGLCENTPVIMGSGDVVTREFIPRLNPRGCLLVYLGTAPGVYGVDKNGKIIRGGYMSAGGGALLKWFKEEFCYLEEETARKLDTSPYTLIDEEASRVKSGSNGLVFIPHMMGERTPYNDFARGVIFGLSLGNKRENIARAVLEGVAFNLRLIWEAVRERSPGFKPNWILTFGGGAKSRIWRQIIADIFGYPTYKLNVEETGALHMACLSSIALGTYKNLSEAYKRVNLAAVERLEPKAGCKEAYDEAYRLFKKVEKSLQAVFSPEYIRY